MSIFSIHITLSLELTLSIIPIMLIQIHLSLHNSCNYQGFAPRPFQGLIALCTLCLFLIPVSFPFAHCKRALQTCTVLIGGSLPVSCDAGSEASLQSTMFQRMCILLSKLLNKLCHFDVSEKIISRIPTSIYVLYSNYLTL